MKSKIIIIQKGLALDYFEFSDLKAMVEKFALLDDVQVWYDDESNYNYQYGRLMFSGKREETDQERKERLARERKERAERKEKKIKAEQKEREQELAELQRLKDKYEKDQ